MLFVAVKKIVNGIQNSIILWLKFINSRADKTNVTEWPIVKAVTKKIIFFNLKGTSLFDNYPSNLLFLFFLGITFKLGTQEYSKKKFSGK